jgi:hypothetical protein
LYARHWAYYFEQKVIFILKAGVRYRASRLLIYRHKIRLIGRFGREGCHGADVRPSARANVFGEDSEVEGAALDSAKLKFDRRRKKSQVPLKLRPAGGRREAVRRPGAGDASLRENRESARPTMRTEPAGEISEEKSDGHPIVLIGLRHRCVRRF